MHGPHVLVLAPADLAVETPAHETVDVDKGVAVDNDATHWFTDGRKLAPFGVTSLKFDACDPAIGRVALDAALPLCESHRAPVTAQEAVRHRITFSLTVCHCEEPVSRTRDTGYVCRLTRAVLWAPP